MSKFGLVIVLILMAGSNYAQDYFVLIRADDGLPFYVRLGSQVYSSSAGGHLILSQLKDSTYSLTIGLPGQRTREQRYTLSIRQKDQEFRLKDQGEKGLSLYDEQTGETKAPEMPLNGGEEIRPPGIKKDDAFSRLMAGVVHDTSVLYNTYAMEQVLKDSSAMARTSRVDSAIQATRTSVSDSAARGLITDPVPAKPDTAVAVNTAVALSSDPKPDTSTLVKPVYRPGGVIKLSERKLARSVRLAYADYSVGKKADTIIIFIPVDTSVIARGGQKPTHAADTGRVSNRGHGPNPDSPLSGQGQNMASHPAPGLPVTEVPRTHSVDTPRKSLATRPSLPFVNSDCHNYATDYDVDKLRVKLLGATKDEDRIQAARRVFKTRCFTTRQIRALSEVFTTDAAKFHFFETAYPFCSDDQFRELSSLLSDPVYSGKFRVMTEHQ